MLKGNIEQFDRDIVRGWVLDADRPEQILRVVVSVNGTARLTVAADLHRSDVEKLCGHGGHGFRIALKEVLGERGGRVSVEVEGALATLAGSSKEFSSSPSAHAFARRLRSNPDLFVFKSSLESEVRAAQLPTRSEAGERRLREVLRGTRVVFVLFSNRTGSNLVTEMLESSGCGRGMTNEPFLANAILSNSKKHSLTSVQHYLAETISAWSMNGMCFLKIGWNALFWLTSQGVLDSILPTATFIWTRRRDKLAQAVSYVKAERRGKFFSLGETAETAPPAQSINGADDALLSDIAEQLYQLHLADARLGYFLTLHQLQALEIVFEDMVADLEGTSVKVRSHVEASLGVKLSDNAFKPRLQKQSSKEDELIKERFVDEMRGPFYA